MLVRDEGLLKATKYTEQQKAKSGVSSEEAVNEAIWRVRVCDGNDKGLFFIDYFVAWPIICLVLTYRESHLNNSAIMYYQELLEIIVNGI